MLFCRIQSVGLAVALASVFACTSAMSHASVFGNDPVAACTELLELDLVRQQAAEVLVASPESHPVEQEQEQEQSKGVTSLNELLIAQVCPLQVDALQQHELAILIARSEQDLRLVDLQGFYDAVSAFQRPGVSHDLDQAVLAGLLLDLDKPEPDPVSLWSRVRQWLNQWWGESEESESLNWLEVLIPSEGTIKAVFYLSIGLVIALTVGIVAVELRAALAHRRKVQRSRWDTQLGGQSGTRAGKLQWEAIANAEPAEQPGLLLKWLLQQLDLLGFLSVSRSATHRDIALAGESLPQIAIVTQVSLAAERAMFGGWTPSQTQMVDLMEAGKRAVQSLEATRSLEPQSALRESDA